MKASQGIKLEAFFYTSASLKSFIRLDNRSGGRGGRRGWEVGDEGKRESEDIIISFGK